MVKKFLLLLLLGISVNVLKAQSYVKLNGLYALVGVINPSIEMPLADKLTFQMEGMYSPWKSVNSRPMHFGIFLNEVRWHTKESYKGWYLGVSAGMQGFYMAKDDQKNCKGWGILIGATTGYQWKLSERLMLEAFVGYGWQHSWYVGYSPVTGEEIFPYNKSAEWLPYKIGLNIGYKFFDPNKKKKRK